MNAGIDHWTIAAAAVERLGIRLRHAVMLAIADSVKRAVAETPYLLDQPAMLEEIGSFDTGSWVETQEGRMMVGIAKAENALWVGGHEHLIPILTGLVFTLKLASVEKEEREMAASAFSLVGRAIRMQAK